MTAQAADTCLEVKGLGRRYGTRWALSDVSFEMDAGEIVAIIGPNGAGKTTLLTIIAGAARATTGEVETKSDRIGWIPQGLGLYGKLSVIENLRFFARIEKLSDPEVAVAEMLAVTDLGERAHDPVRTLSGGNKQRVNVAVGLLGSPDLIVLDEPASGLDAPQRERLWDLLQGRVRGGASIITSTHNMTDAGIYADRVLVLARGRLVFTGSPHDLVERMMATDASLAGKEVPDFETAFARMLRKLEE